MNLKKLSKIKLVISDVDGVLTDGGMYYSAKGDIQKKFHARDGMGIAILQRNGIPTIIITKEKNEIVKKWTSKMKVDKLFQGVKKKEMLLPKLCSLYNLKEENIAYIGDDLSDIPVLEHVGFSACPNDAIDSVKEKCDYI